jgi:hypothetical protein
MRRFVAISIAFILLISGSIEGNITLLVEYLYWKVQEDQLYPFVSFDQSVNSDDINILDFTTQNQKFSYSSGVRIAAGYDFFCRNYDLNLAWTHIHPSTIINISSNDILIFFIDQTNTNFPQATSGQAQWNLNYNMLDLILGCAFMPCKGFTLHPNIGLKGGWIHQTQEIEVNNVGLDGPPPIATEFAQGSFNRRNNFHGVGPRIGVDVDYRFGACFGLFSTVSGALLVGDGPLQTSTFLSETLDNQGNPNGPQSTLLSDSGSRVSATMQLLLGIDGTYCFFQKYEVCLGVGYEVQFWWKQLRAVNSIPQILFVNNPEGSLMMQGLTLQVGFAF